MLFACLLPAVELYQCIADTCTGYIARQKFGWIWGQHGSSRTLPVEQHEQSDGETTDHCDATSKVVSPVPRLRRREDAAELIKRNECGRKIVADTNTNHIHVPRTNAVLAGFGVRAPEQPATIQFWRPPQIKQSASLLRPPHKSQSQSRVRSGRFTINQRRWREQCEREQCGSKRSSIVIQRQSHSCSPRQQFSQHCGSCTTTANRPRTFCSPFSTTTTGTRCCCRSPACLPDPCFCACQHLPFCAFAISDCGNDDYHSDDDCATADDGRFSASYSYSHSYPSWPIISFLTDGSRSA